MNEKQMQEFLQEVIEEGRGQEGMSVSTFEDVGMLTKNAGLVVEVDDGSQFQLTIVQSVYAAGDEDEDEDDEEDEAV